MNQLMNVLMVALLVVSMSLGFSNFRYKREIKNLETVQSELRSNISVLRANLKTLSDQREAEIKAFSEIQTKLLAQRSNQQDSLVELESISNKPKTDGESKNEKADANSTLPDDLTRLLSKHCNSVRGTACQNP